MTDTIPTGWSNSSLAEIGTITGSSVDKKSKDNESVVRLLNYMDIYKNSSLDDSIRYQMVTASDSQLEKANVNYGDVLFTPSSETPSDIGHSSVYLGLGENIVHSYHTVKLRPIAHILDDRYKAYAFNSESCLRFFRERATGSTRYTLTLKDFAALQVSIPPLEEQEKIADILTSVDDTIEHTQAQVAKLQDLKTATMNELLTRGIEHTEFRESELGLIPTTWEIKEIGEVSEFVTSGSRGWAKYYSPKGAIFIRITNLTRAKIDLNLNSIKRVLPPDSAEAARTKVRSGDIVISITADLGVVAVINDVMEDAYVSQHLGLVRLKSEIGLNPRWLGYVLSEERCQRQFIRGNDSGAKAGLSLPTIRNIKITIPLIEEQNKIVRILDSFDDQIEAVELKLVQLESLKKSLMGDLLTGRVRVSVD